MKAAHKKLVADATAARKAIRDKTLELADLNAAAEEVSEALVSLHADLSAIETEAASIGFAVSDLRAAVKL